LFPWLSEELGELTAKQQELVTTLEMIRIEEFILGIISLCFLPQGLSVAIAQYTPENKLELAFSDFFAISSPSEQVNTLSRLANEYTLGDFHCHLLLAPADYRHLTLETPPVANDEMREALRWKIADLVDFSVEQACIDFYLLPDAKHARPLWEKA
jgi:MSHA biogenesis protein MshI